MPTRRPRAVILGWDSAPPALVFDRFADQMPHLSALRRRGCWGPLHSSHPPITVPAWTCMFSSLNPGRLGFFGFRNRTPGDYGPGWIATSATVRAPRLWDLLSAADRRVCLHAVPQTYPPAPVNGLLVADFLTPSTDSEYTYPASLKADLDRVCGGYQIDVDDFRTEDKAGLLARLYQVTEKHHQAALHLLDRERWDLFVSVEMGPDRLQHGFWKYCDPAHPKYQPGNPLEGALLDYYRRLDAQLGELLGRLDEQTLVLVVSDHGAKAMRGSLNLNDFLRQAGLLVLRGDVPPGSHLAPELVNWPRTRVWAWGGYYARVFLNVAGREPQGCVAPGDYHRVREEVADLLRAIPDDQGRPLDTQVLRPEEVFTGPYVAQAPDLLVYFDDLSWRAGQDLNNPGLYSFDTEIGPDAAVHDHWGVLVMAGPGVTSAGELAGLSLLDVAPTVLAHLGFTPPADMEGQVIP